MSSFGALALLMSLAAPAAAQDGPYGPQDRLHGTVADLDSGAPLLGAFVAPQGTLTGFMTDSLGRFTLDVPEAPIHHIYVERLGYVTTRLSVPAEDAGRPLRVLVRPDPVLLEGVEVLVNRWERRRRFYAGSIRAFGQDLLLQAGHHDALGFVRSRAGARISPCPNDPMSYCVRRRGRLVPVTVCIDEMPMFDGGRALEIFSPQDFYLIEVFDQGMQVRLYTEQFVEQTARRRSPVRPLIMGC